MAGTSIDFFGINSLKEELQNLKNDYTDLQNRYNEEIVEHINNNHQSEDHIKFLEKDYEQKTTNFVVQ